MLLPDPMSRQACVKADAVDPLHRFREAFVLPEGVKYFVGNSLGPLPSSAWQRAQLVIGEQWGQGLIRSWNDAGWFSMPHRLGSKLAGIVGGGEDEAVITDSTSSNLFKALAAALGIQRLREPNRKVIVTERDNFPTDIYIAEGLADLLGQGYQLRLIDQDLDLATVLDEGVAVVALSHVNYRTSKMYEMAEVTRLIHDAGALVVWDLAHSAGAVPVDLNTSAADFAVGCTYKYLNGGPGGPAFIWVNQKHHEARQPLSGWWGHRRPFDMSDNYQPAAGVSSYLCGTQPIVSLALVECGLDITLDAGMDGLREKSLALSDLFIALVDERCQGLGLELITPREQRHRGSHISFEHHSGFPVMQALIHAGIMGDYREPGVLRFGLAPLYLRYSDIWDAVEILREILITESWRDEKFNKYAAVT